MADTITKSHLFLFKSCVKIKPKLGSIITVHIKLNVDHSKFTWVTLTYFTHIYCSLISENISVFVKRSAGATVVLISRWKRINLRWAEMKHNWRMLLSFAFSTWVNFPVLRLLFWYFTGWMSELHKSDCQYGKSSDLSVWHQRLQPQVQKVCKSWGKRKNKLF